MPIPIVVGVTGHRDLRKKDIPRLLELVRVELKMLITEYPHSPLVMLNSLAAGADLLCAEVAVSLGIVLKCPIPMAAEEYRQDHEGADLDRYEAVLKRAADVFVAPDTESAPAESNRDYHYRQAGIYVAAHSHVLLALWDGTPAKPGGCGTAEAVCFMLKGRYGCENCFIAANDGAVIHISTPRAGSDSDLTISSSLLENEPGSLCEVLCMTDMFNADAEAMVGPECDDVLLQGVELAGKGNILQQMHGIYLQADGLSLRFQAKYLSAIKYFAIFGVLLVLSFLLYDELEANLFLLCYGLLITTYVIAFLMVRKGAFHMKYLQYRVLSETLRTQFYLSASGANVNIGDSFTWTQKQDSTWIREAVSALLIGMPSKNHISENLIKTAWIDGQLKYHQKALKRNSRKHGINESATRVMLVCSMALFATVLVLEFLCNQVITRKVFAEPFPAFYMQHAGQEVTLRSLLKIVLGGVSAATVFLSNYYGRLSLERKSIDHKKMAFLYASAKKQYEAGRANKSQLFLALAQEEIIENGNWFSYCRENTPSFNL